MTRSSETATVPTKDAYLFSGIFLVVFGLINLARIGYEMVDDGVIGEMFKSFEDPYIEPGPVATPGLGVAVAAIITGIFLVLRRTAARGAALTLAWIALGLGVREIFGLLDEDYLEAASMSGGWAVVGRASGAIVGLVVLGTMFKADRPRLARSRAIRIAGALMLVAGLWELTASVTGAGFGSSLARAFNAAAGDVTGVLATSDHYLEYAIEVALLVVGVLAVLQRRVARGAAFPVLGVVAYLTLFRIVRNLVDGLYWHPALASHLDFRIVLGLLQPFVVLAAVGGALLLLLRRVDAVRGIWAAGRNAGDGESWRPRS